MLPRTTVFMSLAEVAGHIGAQLDGGGDSVVKGLATLKNADKEHLSFFTNRTYLQDLDKTRAGAVILASKDKQRCPVPSLVMENPYLGYARAARLFYPPRPVHPGIHPTAWVDTAARIDESASIGPQCVIEADVDIAAGVVVGPGCILQEGVQVGTNSRLVAGVTLCSGTRLGGNVLIHPGAVIGSDGFGLANENGHWLRIPQLGGVDIGDEVEIGANTSIDKGALEDTVIERGVKLDNQIQIAHNVHIGEYSALAGCVGIAGSTRIGRRCLVGGGVGISGHLKIVDDVHITAGSIVLKSIKEAGVYSSGVPLQTNRAWHRNYTRFKHLDELAKRVHKSNETKD